MSNMLGTIKESALKMMEVFGPLMAFLNQEFAGPMKDFFEKLSGESGEFWWVAFKKFLRKEDPWTNPMDTESQLSRWKEVFKHATGLEIDWSSLVIPERKPGFDRLLVVPKGLTMNKVVEALRRKFKVWLYVEDLDASVPTNDRTNAETYAIWVRDRIESDEENKNLSAKDCASQGIKGETLLERLLHELVYFSEAGKHLDIQNWTLCSGSRDSDGNVPHVCWYSDDVGLQVRLYSSDYHFVHLRARAVVS